MTDDTPKPAPKRQRRTAAKPAADPAPAPATPDPTPAPAPDPAATAPAPEPVTVDPDAGLVRALAAAQAAFPPIAKTKTARVRPKNGGAEYTYNYADLSDVLAAVRPVLAEQGLALVQTTDPASDVLRTELRHVGGGVIVSGVRLGQDPGNPQAFGGALTYHRRYALGSLLGIAPEEDDDAQNVPVSGRQDRAAPTPTLPGWAAMVDTPERKARLLADATLLLGGDGPAAARILNALSKSTGEDVPMIVVEALRRMAHAASTAPQPAPQDPAQAASGEERQDGPDPTAPQPGQAAPDDRPAIDAPPSGGAGATLPARYDVTQLVDEAKDRLRFIQTLEALEVYNNPEQLARMALNMSDDVDPYWRAGAAVRYWALNEGSTEGLAQLTARFRATEEARLDEPPEVKASGATEPAPSTAPEGVAPASVHLSDEQLTDPKALVAAGCTCPAPLAAPPDLSDDCPVDGHGIGF